MVAEDVAVGTKWRLAKRSLQDVLNALKGRGYTVLGPTVRDGAIVYDEIGVLSDLPVGWSDEQEAGRYRLKRCDGETYFGFALGPDSWKKFLHPPELRLWRGERDGNGFRTTEKVEQSPKYAFLGVRSCELGAIAIQDRVFTGGLFVDPHYRALREGAFIVAVNCSASGGTCFCASMGTGPKATSGFDLALTELPDRFVVEVGTERGAEVLTEVPCVPAEAGDLDAAEEAVGRTARNMGRRLDTADLKELLYRNLSHPRWDEVAKRCLTCGNCTMVCPTCFCFTVEDVADLVGKAAERVRRWDSCFTTQFTFTAGNPIRQSAKSRYRQWLTHKLATWVDQFGTFGCVGCGRCIAWCPVGIDITEEVRAIRQRDGDGPSEGSEKK